MGAHLPSPEAGNHGQMNGPNISTTETGEKAKHILPPGPQVGSTTVTIINSQIDAGRDVNFNLIVNKVEEGAVLVSAFLLKVVHGWLI